MNGDAKLVRFAMDVAVRRRVGKNVFSWIWSDLVGFDRTSQGVMAEGMRAVPVAGECVRAIVDLHALRCGVMGDVVNVVDGEV